MRIVLFALIGVVLGYLVWRHVLSGSSSGGASFTRGPLTPKQRRAVARALEAKGKEPWLAREKGVGAISLRGGGILRETFDYLNMYEAKTSFDIRDKKPLFTDDYAEQHGMADAFSLALEGHLRENMPFSFRGIAGVGRIDVVSLADYGNRAYAFVVDKEPGEFIVQEPEYGVFYYNVPLVLRTLEAFLQTQPQMDKVIWLERADTFFMFVIQKSAS